MVEVIVAGGRARAEAGPLARRDWGEAPGGVAAARGGLEARLVAPVRHSTARGVVAPVTSALARLVGRRTPADAGVDAVTVARRVTGAGSPASRCTMGTQVVTVPHPEGLGARRGHVAAVPFGGPAAFDGLAQVFDVGPPGTGLGLRHGVRVVLFLVAYGVS